MSRAPYQPRGWQHEERLQYGTRNLAAPEPGYFKLRLVKGGVFVAACITRGPTPDPETGAPLDRSWLFAAEIDGEPDPDPLPSPNDRVMRVWTYGQRIDRADYEFRKATGAWARQHAPDLPEANPNTRVDIRALPLPF